MRLRYSAIQNCFAASPKVAAAEHEHNRNATLSTTLTGTPALCTGKLHRRGETSFAQALHVNNRRTKKRVPDRAAQGLAGTDAGSCYEIWLCMDIRRGAGAAGKAKPGIAAPAGLLAKSELGRLTPTGLFLLVGRLQNPVRDS
jgi:hypothetical protein